VTTAEPHGPAGADIDVRPAAADRAGEDSPAVRLDAFLARLDRLGLEDLRLIALPLPDAGVRAALLDHVDHVAGEAGRRRLVDEARTRTRAAIERTYARHQYEPTWAGLNWGRSLGTTSDRIGLALAAEDAAVASVMSDLLDEDTAAALAEPFEHAAGMAGSTTTPSLSLSRANPIGWLVWIFFAASGVLVVASYVAGIWVAMAGLAIIAIVAFAWWRRPAA
jgi:hypothetical protein